MSALGIDVGGTFTDAVLVSADRMVTAKVLSTARQEEGVVAAAREVLERAGVEPGDVTHFVHGSTVASNALLERRGGPAILVTTRGFEDLLILGSVRLMSGTSRAVYLSGVILELAICLLYLISGIAVATAGVDSLPNVDVDSVEAAKGLLIMGPVLFAVMPAIGLGLALGKGAAAYLRAARGR